jgi:hypothetical protein
MKVSPIHDSHESSTCCTSDQQESVPKLGMIEESLFVHKHVSLGSEVVTTIR